MHQRNSIKENTNNNSGEPRHRMIDFLSVQIIDELLSNAAISSSAIASKYNVPISTVQRRRAALESMPMVKHVYTLNPVSFGLRPVEFWLMIEKGKADAVAQAIFEKHHNVLSVSLQMNSISNVGVVAYVNSSEQLYNMLEEIKSMPFVENVEFAEIIKVIYTRQANFFKIKAGNGTSASQ